jgi:hypothetical protein
VHLNLVDILYTGSAVQMLVNLLFFIILAEHNVNMSWVTLSSGFPFSLPEYYNCLGKLWE